MRSEWEEVRLEDVTSKIGDGLHGTPKYDENGEYYFINGNNLTNGKIEITANTKRASYDVYMKHKKELNDRTIFVSINGTLGNVALYNGEKIFLGKSACYLNVIDDVDKQFVRYILTSKYFQHYISVYATGTTIKNMGLKSMRDFTFKLPDAGTQKKIARILSTLDDKIELNRKMNQTLEAMAQALFKSWFVDFDPVQVKAGCESDEELEAAAKELGISKEVLELFPSAFVESDMGMIPEGWEVAKIKDLMMLHYGKALKKSDRIKGEIPVYGSGGITGYHNTALINKASIIIGRKGTVGSLYWEDNPFYPIDTVFYIESKEMPLTFCYYLLQTLSLKHMNTDAAVPGLNRNNVYRLKIVKPPEKLIKSFDKIISEFRRKMHSNNKEIQALQKTRDTLLPKLLSGELDVSKVEI
jgi:type I restriction enzyme S subunit